jgi:DNA-binding MarR family transcriptional regulator
MSETTMPNTNTARTRAEGSDAAVTDDTAPRLRLVIARVARQLRQNVDVDTGLTTSLLSALATVDRVGPVTLGELAAAERVQPPSMTRIVGKLEGRGLVVRTVDPQDRRVSRLEVSPDGVRLLLRSRTRKNAFLARRLKTLTPEELAALETALPVLERIAEEGR